MKERMERIGKMEYVLFLLLLFVVFSDVWDGFEGKLFVAIGALLMAGFICLRTGLMALRQRWSAQLQVDERLSIDAMTGLYNHRKVNDVLREIVAKSEARQQEMAVLYFDLDDFRPINDNYGFDVGDLVLKHVVGILRDGVRSGDVIGRYAGDEFLMILPNTTCEEANRIADRLQFRLNTTPFRFSQYEEALPIAVSIGMACYPGDALDAQTLLDGAILSNIEAKRQGKAKIQRVPSYMQIEKYVQDSHNLGMFIRALKDKDTYTVEHSEDVARYSLVLADALNLPEEMKIELRTAGLFHDIGKILIPDHILKKPGRLTDDEYLCMRQHVVLSHEILIMHYTSETMKQAVICHHERFDGRGYPLGLKGREIPLAGRIMAIADAYSAMTLDRSYRKSKTYEEGLAEIRRCAGTQFDPELAELFCGEIEKKRHLLSRSLDHSFSTKKHG